MNAVAMRVAGRYVPPLTIATARSVFGGGVLLVIARRGKADWPRAWPWLIGNALAGPSFGVACYQWALMTTPTNIVLPIVATTPLLVIPLAHFLEGERITRRAVVGGIIAVAGVVGLTLAK